jgi:hypothetical protein
MDPLDTWVAPDACTLPTAERPLRVAEFDALFGSDVTAVDRETDVRLRLDLRERAGLAAEVADLTARESACCSFFGFTQRQDGQRRTLTIEVPPDQVAALDALAERAAQLSAGAAR